MKAPRSRGQTLVVFALTLLLLTLMVLLTISFGMRVRERMELQTLADAAAYSNAVAAARTFNVMAVMNRTELSLLVAQSATQAYISWTSAYWGALNKLSNEGFGWAQAQIPITCTLLQIPAAEAALLSWRSAITQEISQIQQKWDNVDIAASAQVRNLNSAQASMYANDFDANYRKLEQTIKDQALTGEIVAMAQPLSPWQLSAPPDATNSNNMREIDRGCDVGVACDGMPSVSGSAGGDNTIMHQYEIYMGTRGDGFTTGRDGGAMLITAKLSQMLSSWGAALYTGQGASYRGDQFDGPLHGAQGNPGAAHSDDDGSVGFFGTFGGCPIAIPPLGVETHVRANLNANPDVHTWSGGTCPNQSHISHSLIGDIAGGNWPIVIDYNTDQKANAINVHGQPKLYAIIQREYEQRMDGKPEPYMLDFKFKFAGSSTPFNNRGKVVGGQSMMQTAVASGLAYYHRANDWQEPPNFMNPFWRATLVVPDIDTTPQNVIEAIEAADGRAGAAAKALLDNGFKGWQ
jgi:hypothetical protein